MMSSVWSRDLGTIYRPDTKWRLNCVLRWDVYCKTKELFTWTCQSCHMKWVKCTEQQKSKVIITKTTASTNVIISDRFCGTRFKFAGTSSKKLLFMLSTLYHRH